MVLSECTTTVLFAFAFANASGQSEWQITPWRIYAASFDPETKCRKLPECPEELPTPGLRHLHRRRGRGSEVVETFPLKGSPWTSTTKILL